MANPPRTRKRVLAVLRAPDGSAYQRCKNCGVSVAVALAGMHECENEKEVVVKRFRGVCVRQSGVEQSSRGQPRSPFRFFMESFAKTCKTRNLIRIDRQGFGTWKNMSQEERKPYIIKAERVNSSYFKTLVEEVNNKQEVDDEADSGTVGTFDQLYEGYESSQYGETESFGTLLCPIDFLKLKKQK